MDGGLPAAARRSGQFSVWAEAAQPVSGGLREILDSVVADPGADHSTAAMAGRAVVSERHLVRMFRDQVGMTPARFVEKARLEAAKVLLATSDHSQDAVARRAGFGTSDTLRRTFRRNLGCHPGYTGTASAPPESTSSSGARTGRAQCAAR